MRLHCEICSSPYRLIDFLVKKTCMCDEEERIISLSEWYRRLFRVSFDLVAA